MRYALLNNIITEEDLYTDDEKVLKKIRSSLEKDSQLKVLYQQMDSGNCFIIDSENYDVKVVTKSRMVDPLFIENENVCRLSCVDANWQVQVTSGNAPKEYYFRYADTGNHLK